MKVCYVDESGNQSDPCFVMVGIVVDALRLNRTQTELGEIFHDIHGHFPAHLQEIKGAKMISGKGGWRNVSPEVRKKIVGKVCSWIRKRKHRLVLTAVDQEAFEQHKTHLPKECQDMWLVCGLHIALQIQKLNQKQRKNKGKTFLVIDDNKQKADKYSELLYRPPEWTDDYYARLPKQDRMDQIIDTAFTIKSHHADLVQVADVFAFIFRRFAEINDYKSQEVWQGERNLITDSVSTLSERFISRPWPARPPQGSARWFSSTAPMSLRGLRA